MGTDNLFHRRKAKQANDMKRRQGKRAPYDKVLIVCEGEKTEPNYFNELKDFYKLNSANVKVTGDCGSSPKSVVNYARELYRQAGDAGDPFDRVFCVFDKDTHDNYHSALDTLRSIAQKGVFTAITSVPCFEYWLLLHFKYTDRPFHATGSHSIAATVLRELRVEWPEYEKAIKGSFAHCIKQLDFAKANARRVLLSAEANSSDNPSTRVHELVEYLQHIQTRKTQD